LENVRLKIGGKRVWSSNWVPSKWSARELYHGDNYHLALAYFQAGLADEGWEILKGNFLDAAFAKVVPGAQAVPEGGTDFNDVLGPFCRSVVEGLFGYAPDLVQSTVRIQPGLPADWPLASITTPDYSLRFNREGASDHYQASMTRAAALDLRIPVRAESIRGVKLNGAAVAWKSEPGAGCTVVRIQTAKTQNADLVIELGSRLPHTQPRAIAAKLGDNIRLNVARGTIVETRDLNQALAGTTARKAGHHIVLAKVQTGQLQQWNIFKLHVTDPVGDAKHAAQTLREAPRNAAWECLDLKPICNGDIRAIYKQQYLSPRPSTVSVRIGVDGYSPWTFAPWKIPIPEIDLANIATLTDARGRIVTPQNAQFTRMPDNSNIAFTSLWDNFPHTVSIPVNREAEALWLLIAGTTNPMQTKIANAEIRFLYTDGQTEKLELIPPFNFWTLCHLGGRDYSYERDAFCLPQQPPPTVQLGNNCRAMVLSWKLRRGVALSEITMEARSREVVIGLMGVSLMNAV
jgi:hypothetical protein